MAEDVPTNPATDTTSNGDTQPEPEHIPDWLFLWGKIVHVMVWTAYFLLISMPAWGIDIGLHWFDGFLCVHGLHLSSVLVWEVEAMAYTLATVDCFFFLRALIEPVVLVVMNWVKR